MNLVEVRNRFFDRLALLVHKQGAASLVADAIGVSRAQFSRYMSRQSMPRPEVVYKLSLEYNIPMEWFFEDFNDAAAALTEHSFGASVREIVRGRKLGVSDAMLEDGFYLLWRAQFFTPDFYECILYKITNNNGTKKMRGYMRWSRMQNEGADFVRDCVCSGTVMASGHSLYILFSDTERNIVVSGSLFDNRGLMSRRVYVDWSGFFTLNSRQASIEGGDSGLFSNTVPVLLQRIESRTGKVLDAARKCGSYERSKLPQFVASQLDSVGVPRFSVRC